MNAREIVAKVKRLPATSPAAMRLIRLLNHDEVDNDEIVYGLKTDMALTAKVLRACNSSSLSFSEPVSSVDQALLILGHQEVLRITLALAYGSAMTAPLPGYEVAGNELWLHSLATANGAEVVVTTLELPMNPQVAFTIGLLHDIGKLVLSQVITSEVQTEIRQKIHQCGLSCAEAEKQILGIDHAEVGACLLEDWRLPEAIVEAVAHHHHPALISNASLAAVAHVADCLAHLSGSAPGWDAYAVRVCDPVANLFKITPSSLERMVISVRESCIRMRRVTENTW